MERELEEMHEAVDQALRAALMGLGSVRERKARSDQVKADQARVAAAADRSRFEAYQQAQDSMLRGQLGNVTDPKWWDTTDPTDIAATVDLAERYADISPYAEATLTNLRSEAERRGVDLTPAPRADTPSQTAGHRLDGATVSLKKGESDDRPTADGKELADLMGRYDEESRGYAALQREAEHGERHDGPDERWGPGNPKWDEAAQGYENNLDELQDRINALGAAGYEALDSYSRADDAGRDELIGHMREDTDHTTPTSIREPSGPTSTAEQARGYERSRASDMAGADPQHVQARLAVAKSFIHPIRAYTTGRSKTGGGEGGRAPSRRQQLKRGK